MNLKLLITIFLLVIISGCIGKEKKDEKIDNIEGTNIMQNISISAEAFKYGDTIPDKYTCMGKDISPELSWTGIPEGTNSILLIMDDPDAPGATFVHWILFDIPATTQKLPVEVQKSKTLNDFSRHGINDFGSIGYGGPCPPPGKPHRYYFRIYALDKMLELLPGTSMSQVDLAIKGHILAKGELMGMK